MLLGNLAAVQRSHLVEEFVDCAEKLRERFDEAFWCEELSLYALALDGDKRPCRVRTSDAGHCLFSGIALPDRAARVAQALHRPESFSGWGFGRWRSPSVYITPWATTQEVCCRTTTL
jgi:glycogen debranching enzyme